LTTAWLVVNADDLGVSPGMTLGVVKAHREGIVTSASLAVTTPYYEHAVDTCVRECPELGIGLHFTLTSGKPVSAPDRVPRLRNSDGFFRWRFLPLLAAATARERSDLLDQVEIELEAQLGRLVRDDIHPDHIDGERHVHLIPGIFERVVAAAQRHGVPFVRVGRDIGLRFVNVAHAPGLLLRGGFPKSWLVAALSARNRRRFGGGLRAADGLASYLYSGRLDLLVKRLLSGPPAPGITEVMVHPGLPEQSRGVALGNRELERYVVSEDRRRELEVCVEARGHTGEWELTNFRRLAQRPAR
jgi:predicted glycoside hydrolase/deacetylase ChbG (UPF0249 family)